MQSTSARECSNAITSRMRSMITLRSLSAPPSSTPMSVMYFRKAVSTCTDTRGRSHWNWKFINGSQRRRNHEGNRGAHPRNAETAGAKVSFRPAIIYKSSHESWSEWLPGLILAGLQSAGELTWRTQNAPKLLAAGALPQTPLGAGAYSVPPDPTAGGRGLPPPLQEPHPWLSPIRVSSFSPSGLASPPQCWFRFDATDVAQI